MKALVLLLICNLSLAKNKLPPKPTSELKPLSEKQMSRVDPHGAYGQKPTMEMLKDSKECQICHVTKSQMKPVALETCFNCHNRAPHSGVSDHEKHKITCLSCHSFHRGDNIEMQEASGRFNSINKIELTKGLTEKKSKKAMLKKDCTDCHKW